MKFGDKLWFLIDISLTYKTDRNEIFILLLLFQNDDQSLSEVRKEASNYSLDNGEIMEKSLCLDFGRDEKYTRLTTEPEYYLTSVSGHLY